MDKPEDTPQRQPTDDELVALARRSPPGDYAAFERIVRRHQGSVIANCRYITGSTEDAEDLAQEVFARIYVRLEQFRGDSSFKTWMYRIKVNHCLKFLRRRKRAQHVDIETAAASDLTSNVDHHKHMERDLERGEVRRIVEAMPESLRVPLILRDLDGLAYAEIAQALDLKLSAAKMRVRRARAHFRERYKHGSRS